MKAMTITTSSALRDELDQYQHRSMDGDVGTALAAIFLTPSRASRGRRAAMSEMNVRRSFGSICARPTSSKARSRQSAQAASLNSGGRGSCKKTLPPLVLRFRGVLRPDAAAADTAQPVEQCP